MDNIQYAVVLVWDEKGFSAYIPDIPEVCAGGLTIHEATVYAERGLKEALRARKEKGEILPSPCNMDEAREKVRAERELDNLPFREDSPVLYLSIKPKDL